MRGMPYAGGRQGQGIFLSKGRTVARNTPETLLPKSLAVKKAWVFYG